MKKLFYFIIILIFSACSVTTEEDSTATSSTTLPDYETTTLSGKISGTAWTFKTGRVTVPSSTGLSLCSVSKINDNLSDACSSTYTATSSNPKVFFGRDNLTVGETELGWGTGYGTVTFYDGSTNYIVTTGKITIDTHTTTALTGKMYAKSSSNNEINGTFTLSRCCFDSEGSTYDLCE